MGKKEKNKKRNEKKKKRENEAVTSGKEEWSKVKY